jgi:hypothetical protein
MVWVNQVAARTVPLHLSNTAIEYRLRGGDMTQACHGTFASRQRCKRALRWLVESQPLKPRGKIGELSTENSWLAIVRHAR